MFSYHKITSLYSFDERSNAFCFCWQIHHESDATIFWETRLFLSIDDNSKTRQTSRLGHTFSLHALASFGQVLIGIGRTAHFFREHGTQAAAVLFINGDIWSPLGNMVRMVLGHAASETGVVQKSKYVSCCLK